MPSAMTKSLSLTITETKNNRLKKTIQKKNSKRNSLRKTVTIEQFQTLFAESTWNDSIES